MRRTFSKAGLQETWDFYQERQGPKTLELLPEDERQVLNEKFTISESELHTILTPAAVTKRASLILSSFAPGCHGLAGSSGGW